MLPINTTWLENALLYFNVNRNAGKFGGEFNYIRTELGILHPRKKTNR